MRLYWIYTTTHTHTHIPYIYAHKVSAGAALLSGIMLLKTQLSGEKPQTERGDAVRNVYRAARGRTAEDEGAPRALRIRSRPQRLVLDSEVELEVDLPSPLHIFTLTDRLDHCDVAPTTTTVTSG